MHGRRPASFPVFADCFVISATRANWRRRRPSSIASPRLGRKLPSLLTQDEVLRLLDAPDLGTPQGVRDAAMLHVMYAAGLRVSELVGLLMSDLDLRSGYLTVLGKGRKRRSSRSAAPRAQPCFGT